MKIKYETNGSNCLTLCPYNQTNEFLRGEIIRVSGNACKRCEHYKYDDVNKNELECSFK